MRTSCIGPAISKYSLHLDSSIYCSYVCIPYSSTCYSYIMLCDCICRYITGCFVLYYDAFAGFHHNGSITTTSVIILMWAPMVF
jgi:hypothetical protein